MENFLWQVATISPLISSYKLKIMISKFDFAKHEVELLGHIISADGIAINPNMIDAIRAAPVPESGTTLRPFSGLAGYYGIFMQGFTDISGALYSASSKNTKFS